MLTRYAMDRRYAEQALKAREAAPDGNWLAATLTGGEGGIPGRLRREVSPGPQDRTGAGPEPGAHPVEILRELQMRQVESVLTEPMPGPHAWAALELPLPGAPGDGHTQVVKTGTPAPQHAAAEA